MVAYEASGKMPDELANAPECPEEVEYVWEYFLRLHRVRGGTGFGPKPLAETIDKWPLILGLSRLRHSVVQMILRIDAEYLSVMASK